MSDTQTQSKPKDKKKKPVKEPSQLPPIPTAAPSEEPQVGEVARPKSGDKNRGQKSGKKGNGRSTSR